MYAGSGNVSAQDPHPERVNVCTYVTNLSEQEVHQQGMRVNQRGMEVLHVHETCAMQRYLHTYVRTLGQVEAIDTCTVRTCRYRRLVQCRGRFQYNNVLCSMQPAQ
jgi:hypothetical protein